jgi:hypothetical protein
VVSLDQSFQLVQGGRRIQLLWQEGFECAQPTFREQGALLEQLQRELG